MNFNKSHSLSLFVGILSSALLPLSLQAQTPQPATGCTQNKDVYVCDRASFAKTLKAAKTIAIETRPTDHTSTQPLTDLVRTLGKTPQSSPADLTFSLSPAITGGIIIGPSGAELATLRVYSATRTGPHATLVWAETFYGQPDMTWPATANALIRQFQTNFK